MAGLGGYRFNAGLPSQKAAAHMAAICARTYEGAAPDVARDDTPTQRAPYAGPFTGYTRTQHLIPRGVIVQCMVTQAKTQLS